MQQFLCFTIRFLRSCFHGRSEHGEPEWPPSPLRLFQALVAAAAARWNERTELHSAASALRWLEQQKPPILLAPQPVVPSNSDVPHDGFPLYVPDNVTDNVARSWMRGGNADIADYRTLKNIRASYLPSIFSDPPAADTLHYLFPLPSPPPPEVYSFLRSAARSMTHLGWGIDMVVADAVILHQDQIPPLSGQYWFPTDQPSSVRLRVPVVGTLDDLCRRHRDFLHRISKLQTKDTFAPVPPLARFGWIYYRRPIDRPAFPLVAFRLLQPDGTAPAAFESRSYAAVLPAMFRALVAEVASRSLGWSPEKILRQVHGHEPAPPGQPAPKALRQDPLEPRLAYLPLPTVHRWGTSGLFPIGAIRRLLLVGMPGMEQEVSLLGQYLAGQLLRQVYPQPREALLGTLPRSDWVLQRYLQSAVSWTTVSPVVLPGYDDRSDKKTDALLRKALRQAGFADQLVQHAQLDWRKVGFLPGVDLAERYFRPKNIQKTPVWHVKITWCDEHGQPIHLPGPIAIGSGRFRGLGVFVSLDS